MNRNQLLTLLLCLFLQQAYAIDPLPFSNEAEAVRFQHLVAELRCTVCQNQNLADSNASLAKDLRQKVFELIQAGKSDQQIKDYLAERYGDFVLYSPPLKPLTWLLWFGPALVFLLGAGVIFFNVQRRKKTLSKHAQAIDDESL